MTLAARPAALLLLTAGLLTSCGTDEALELDPTTPIEAGGGDGSAGLNASGASSGGVGPIGGGSTTDAGEGPDLAGMPGGGSAHAGAPPAVAGAAGDDAGPAMEQLDFCVRITNKIPHASDVARLFDHAVYDDCRIRWVSDLYLEQLARQDFLNDLVQWNLRFWGCMGDPVESFALIYGTAPLSAGDAALLIEHYIAVASVELDMSQQEIADMQAALERLSKALIADTSQEPSQPRCDMGSGGAGGSGGDAGPGGADNAGGTAPVSAAGQGGVQ